MLQPRILILQMMINFLQQVALLCSILVQILVMQKKQIIHHHHKLQMETVYTKNRLQVTEDRRKLRLDFLEESKQLSPVSVLEETESSDDDSPNVKKQECHKAKKQEEFSTPSVSNSWEKSPESQYIKNKKAMQQSRQLLFDCVKEVVENQKRKEEFQRILGAEQLWGLLLQNIMLWSQDSINETSINHLMHFDLLNSFEESSGIEEKWEIGKVVGDLIFVDISNEIALDMLNSSSSR
ncbi:uncharacterized protein LOC132033496 isoform X3 [Lycium ferocissimum]|uniref:uncharacterized protein LOC132033496 isoform X3 n=1 Tax=Lycium ferocissimum TaxID=112874 RepID=UPI002814BA0A|nr:uncharacterized protein LOC132033496 isoform X3 [Lycium ferocissimum]